MDGNLYTLELLSEIEAEGALKCRVHVPFHFKNFMDLDMLEKAVDDGEALRLADAVLGLREDVLSTACSKAGRR